MTTHRGRSRARRTARIAVGATALALAWLATASAEPDEARGGRPSSGAATGPAASGDLAETAPPAVPDVPAVPDAPRPLPPGRGAPDLLHEPARGRLLVAAPRQSGERSPFAESVILLLAHQDAGSIGVIVNWPGRESLSKVGPSIPELQGREDRVHLGGPMEEDRLVLLLRTPSAPPDSLEIFPGAWVTGSIRALRELVRERGEKAQFRVYAGRATWGPGQLQREIDDGAWLVTSADAASVFSPEPATLWKRLVDRLSGRWVGVRPPKAIAAG